MFSWSDATLSPAGKPMMKLETPRSMYWRRSAAICSGRPFIQGREPSAALLKRTSVLKVRSTAFSSRPACTVRRRRRAMRPDSSSGSRMAGGTQANGHPAVAVAGGATDGRAGVAADPDGRMRLLRGLWRESAAGNLVELAIEGRGIAGPQFLVQLDVLISNCATPGVAVPGPVPRTLPPSSPRLRPG